MLFVKTTCTRFVAWSLTIAMVGNGPMLSAEQQVSEGPTAQAESVMQDVKLAQGGILTARVVDLQGKPVVSEHVSVMFQGKEIAALISDSRGVVVVRGLRPGLHAIVTPTGTMACRLWNADTAPPTATAIPAVVSDTEIIRGQFGAFNLPMIVVLAAAVGGLVVAVDAQNTADDAQSANEALAVRVKALENASP